MTDSFYFRDPSLASLVGPLTTAELIAALRSGSLPGSGEVCRSLGQSAAEAAASGDWTPAHRQFQLPQGELGSPVPSPAADEPSTQPVPSAAATAAELCALQSDLRAGSAYRSPRQLTDMLAVAAGLAVLVAFVVTAYGALRGRLPGSVETVGAQMIVTVLELAAIVVLRALVQALFDVSDCALRRERAR